MVFKTGTKRTTVVWSHAAISNISSWVYLISSWLYQDPPAPSPLEEPSEKDTANSCSTQPSFYGLLVAGNMFHLFGWWSSVQRCWDQFDCRVLWTQWEECFQPVAGGTNEGSWTLRECYSMILIPRPQPKTWDIGQGLHVGSQWLWDTTSLCPVEGSQLSSPYCPPQPQCERALWNYIINNDYQK